MKYPKCHGNPSIDTGSRFRENPLLCKNKAVYVDENFFEEFYDPDYDGDNSDNMSMYDYFYGSYCEECYNKHLNRTTGVEEGYAQRFSANMIKLTEQQIIDIENSILIGNIIK